ncbi:hypothetical protein [Streptomyces cinnamoneus]|uniref:hypothetical protein n=1 Tax=Streptomyces cinnamoneus TaxID=53446 RepID=UPI0015E3FF52|nr:hypothetical protein [Streptomyces cinnamoneus]
MSVAQVAGSALAAVVAALLAGKLGVYGTVIGAGVVSVVATTGGTLFHHLFKRTGEQIREVTVQGEPRLRQVPLREAGRAVGRARAGGAAAAASPDAAARGHRAAPDRARLDETRMLPTAEDATRRLHQASQPGASPAQSEAHAGAYTGAHDHARFDAYPGDYSEEYSHGTTHGTRLRGWKRPLLAAGAVFVLAMGTVTAVELVSGSSADGSKDGTTVSRLFQPDKQEEKQDPPSHTPGPHHSPGGGQEPGDEPTPTPGASRPGGGADGRSPSPGPSSSSGGGSQQSPGPTPAPSGSPDGGKGTDEGKGGPSGAPATGSAPPPQGQNAAAGTGTTTS